MSTWKSHGISGCSCELRAISSAALSSASMRPWKKWRCSSGSIGTWFSAPFTYSSRDRYGSPSLGDLHEVIAGRLVERRQDAQVARLLAQAHG